MFVFVAVVRHCVDAGSEPGDGSKAPGASFTLNGGAAGEGHGMGQRYVPWSALAYMVDGDFWAGWRALFAGVKGGGWGGTNPQGVYPWLKCTCGTLRLNYRDTPFMFLGLDLRVTLR